MKTTTKFAALSLAVLTLGLAGAVSASSGQGMGYGMGYGMGQGMGPGAGAAAADGCGMGPGMRGGMHGGMRGGMRGPDSPAVAAARLSDLKAELSITDSQEAAWQAYAGVVQQQTEQRQAMRTGMQAQMRDPQAAATVDRAAKHESMQRLRESNLAARNEAISNLYAVLTPEQKALADQRLRGPYGHRMAQRGAGR